MKNNAIIRIVIWSLVIVVLVGILSAGLGITWILPSKTIAASPVETAIPATIPDEAAVPLSLNYEVKEATDIRATPNPEGTVLGIAEAGEHVNLVEDMTISGLHWGRIQAPEEGWILLESNVEETQSNMNVPSPSVSSGDANIITADSEGISRITIDWVAGEIHIFAYDGNTIRVEESGDTERYSMQVTQKKDKLTVEYTSEKNLGFGISINADITKDLNVLVPRNLLVKELDINTASAVVLVENLDFQEVEFEGASGQCEFVNCGVDTLDVNTASGDIYFTGTLKVLECDAASANFKAELFNVPNRLEMESMSGNLEVTLPEDAGFTVQMEGMNSDFSSDFETTSKNGVYTHGDGVCRIQMEAMSGDVVIRKPR